MATKRPVVIDRTASLAVPVDPVGPAGPRRPSATFDLYFVPYPQDGDWGDVMIALERSRWRMLAFGDRDRALWQRMLGRVEPFLPGAEVTSIPGMYELTHAQTGIQFSFVPGAIVLSVPYRDTAEAAERLVALLRRIVTAVESETGLTAYDSQAEAPFLAYGAGSAAATLQLRGPAGVGADRLVAALRLPKPRGWRRLTRPR